MSRIEILGRALKEWRSKVDDLPNDEKPVAYIIAIVATLVTLVCLIGLVALILNVLASFWWVFVVGAVLWYFWPRISDLIKKRG